MHFRMSVRVASREEMWDLREALRARRAGIWEGDGNRVDRRDLYLECSSGSMGWVRRG